MPILGLHHVTATVDDAQDDLDFCLEDSDAKALVKFLTSPATAPIFKKRGMEPA